MSMAEHEKPKLHYTRDLSLFEMHETNRNLSEKPALEESMKQHGFMPSSPLHCIRNGHGKLKVIRGHHRLDYAKRLGIGVWYVIDTTVTDIFELEGDSSSRWTLADFVAAYAKAKNEDYIRVIDFQKRHGVGLGAAVSLMAGESAGSLNAVSKAKRGTFRVSKDLSHANLIGELVDFCRATGASCAGETSFVNALSAVARVPEFEPLVFKQRVAKMPSLIAKQATGKNYLTIIEEVYNYGAKGKRVPLAFRAVEVGRHRKETFGRCAQKKTEAKSARPKRPTKASSAAQITL